MNQFDGIFHFVEHAVAVSEATLEGWVIFAAVLAMVLIATTPLHKGEAFRIASTFGRAIPGEWWVILFAVAFVVRVVSSL